MIFYSNTSLIAIGLASIPAMLSIYYFLYKDNIKIGLSLLFISGLLLRFAIAAFDPYLNEWDERFHALVAKNMIQFPFKPMLHAQPIMPYDIGDWCCNHIWVHKQPLFMWQMAGSMYLFGINEVAMRLPSVFMGALSILFIFEIGNYWTNNKNIAFFAGFLFAFSYYQLELTSGRLGLDHNDAAFSFYVLASIWAFVKYLKSKHNWKWAILIGLFVGFAILIKWLTGLLVFGGWGLYLLQTKDDRQNLKKWKHLFLAVILCCLVFIPWQIYIMTYFPEESSIMYESNRKHITEALQGHSGGFLYHIKKLDLLYSTFVLPFLALGSFLLFRIKHSKRILSISFFAMIVVIYFFFSIIVKTKMPAFTYPVAGLIWIIISSGIIYSINYLNQYFKSRINRRFLFGLLFLFFGIMVLQPMRIVKHRSINNEWRNAKINNTYIFKELPLDSIQKRIILNCKSFENVELMFYQDVNAYHWFHEEQLLDSMMNLGYQFAAFKSHTNQHLPDYIEQSERIYIIDRELR